MAFEGLSEKLNAAFRRLRGKGRITEADVREAMKEVRLALLDADVSYSVVKDFVAKVTERAVGTDVLESLTPAQQIIKIVNEELTELMGGGSEKISMASKGPTIIMMVGLQGAGKTTNGAKLAGYLQKNLGKRPLLVACDVYRPAAITQLQVVGQQLDIPVFALGQVNPVQIAQHALRHARDNGFDTVLLDTAGRLHIDEQLMNELKNIKSAVTPNEILLVVDAMTGQDVVNVVEAFADSVDFDGVIMSKMDGDARGGGALSIREVTGKPIKFISSGEKPDSLEQFHPDRMAKRILGMGDVLTLIEKAQEEFDEEKAKKLGEKMRRNEFDFEMYLESMGQMKKMGSLASILEMIPGMGGKITEEDAQQGEQQMRRTEAIIQSMTPAEREKPSLLNPSRKRRIAAGSGTRVEDVNRLIRQLADTQKMMKQFTGGKGKRRRGRMPFGGGMPGLPM